MGIREGYKKTEVGVVPQDWECAELGTITSKIGSGITPTGGSRIYRRTGRPFVRSQNVHNGKMNLTDIAYIDEATHNTFEGTEILDGDVLLNITGASIGRSSVADVTVVGGNVNQHVCILRPVTNKVNSLYMCSYILSAKGQKYIDDFQSGGNRQGLNFKQIASIKIPIPPLPEQQAIASAISDFNGLTSSLTKLINKKKNIKQGAMQELLTGKKRFEGFSGEWEVKTIGDCLEEKPSYGINAVAVPYDSNLPAYIRITDISDDGKFIKKDRTSVLCNDTQKYQLKETDIVFARTGASTGKSYLYNPKDGVLVFAGFLIRIRINVEKAIPRYIKACVETSIFWDWVKMISTRSGQPGINGNEYASFIVPVPSLIEQEAIADILSDMDNEIEALEQKLNKYKGIKQGMMQELLTGRIRFVEGVVQ